jgi:ABC-2 type transport system permease protein
VVLPVVIIVVIGTTFGTMEGVDVGVLDRDGTAASRGLVTALDRSDGVSVERYDSLDTLRRDIRTGSVAAGLVVPDGYGDDIDRGLDATVELIADPTTGSAAAVQATVRAAVGDAAVQIAAARVAADAGGSDDAAAERAAASLADQVPRAGVRSESVDEGRSASLGSFDYTAPSNLVLFTFVNTIVIGSLIALERKQGITRRMLATPHGTGTILAGVGAAKFLFALLQSALIIAIGAALFGVGWGDPLAAAVLVVLFALVATAVGLLVGATVSDPDQAQAVGVPIAIGLGMLGGCMWPLEIVPPVMRAAGHVAPHAWAMDASIALIFDGEGVGAVAGDLAVLAAYAVVLGLLARRRLRRALTA